ncbi:phenylalanine--tRNA ligase subunit beta [Oscillatoria amoena NRMC-F 0135]|nr:phenylalanine--tRNA ligase subunit beta [Geitlerinema splendidum]MDL5050471.1 phenylalanine--tRNA ligase subunit beta [Oscillatoria amoena NRMC-F 0135]
MRISLNWLRELVDITLSPEELAQTLTMAGFEVEDIEDRRTWADGVVVGRILEAEPHPNADKLRVCQVDVGEKEPLNIVCGASNARAGILVAVATIGTYLPTIDLKIKPTKLRGVRSEGMICSLSELGLEKQSEGIHIFTQDALALGTDVRSLLGLDDVILDLTSTANRADALSMVGVAREVAALTGGALHLPEIPETTIAGNHEDLNMEILEKVACPAYIGTLIDGIKIAPSPEWLQSRLLAAGVRPINNVVDATNYILLEWGQPLHAFDRDRLQTVTGEAHLTIGVRFANPGETLKTLDGQARTLQPQTLLITANDRPVALAGVMGGEETEVYEGTTRILLEAALFDPLSIRRSARTQGLRTEASARYERGVNQAELEVACRRAIALIQEVAAGVPTTQAVADARPDKSAWTRAIELRQERIHQVLGQVEVEDNTIDIPARDIERILTALGCQLESVKKGVWRVTVPPYRYRDLEREIDLIEEIARLYGYDRFCETLPVAGEPGYLPLEEIVTRRLREAFRAAGLTEVLHYSYAVTKTRSDRQIHISNPLFTEYSSLRTELLSGLIQAFQYNLEQGNGPLNGFEIGRVFSADEDGLLETEALAGIIGGDPSQGKWTRSGRDLPMTWYEAKGILESVFQRLGLPAIEYQPNRQDERLHPGRTASLWLQGERLGNFGQLHPQLRQELGLPDAVYGFELELETIYTYFDREESLRPLFQPFATYPAADRDIAFFAPVEVSVADIQKVVVKAAREKGGESLLESVELFDEYRGEHVVEGQRSLAFRLVYRGSDRTLTDAEVEPLHQKVRDALVEKFGVSLRS